METVLKVRLAAKREGQSLRGIAKQYRLSRNTMRRYLRSGEVDPHYRRQQEVKPKLGPYLADLEQLPADDAKLPTPHRRSALLLFEELQRRGYQGAYDSVRRHVQAWKREQRGSQDIFIPLRFAPGEAFQFDWDERPWSSEAARRRSTSPTSGSATAGCPSVSATCGRAWRW